MSRAITRILVGAAFGAMFGAVFVSSELVTGPFWRMIAGVVIGALAGASALTQAASILSRKSDDPYLEASSANPLGEVAAEGAIVWGGFGTIFGATSALIDSLLLGVLAGAVYGTIWGAFIWGRQEQKRIKGEIDGALQGALVGIVLGPFLVALSGSILDPSTAAFFNQLGWATPELISRMLLGAVSALLTLLIGAGIRMDGSNTLDGPEVLASGIIVFIVAVLVTGFLDALFAGVLIGVTSGCTLGRIIGKATEEQ